MKQRRKIMIKLIAIMCLVPFLATGQMFLKYPKELNLLGVKAVEEKFVEKSELYTSANILYVLPMKNPNFKTALEKLNKHLKSDAYLGVNSIVAIQDGTPDQIAEVVKNKPNRLTFIADKKWLVDQGIYIEDSTRMYGFLYDQVGEVSFLGYMLDYRTIKASQKYVDKMLQH